MLNVLQECDRAAATETEDEVANPRSPKPLLAPPCPPSSIFISFA